MTTPGGDDERPPVASHGRAVTAEDVARAAGVHASTVSRSLDPLKRDRVRPATRQRVLEAAAQLGYQLNLTASSLRRRQSRTVGVLISSFSNPIYGELLHGIGAELERLGYHMLITEVPDEADENRLSEAIDMMRSRRIDGLICASARGRDAGILRELAHSGMPVVLCLRWIQDTGLPRVANDDAFGGELAARHLLELGHERILEITGPTDISTFAERAAGFQRVLTAYTSDDMHRRAPSLTPTIEEGFRVMAAVLDAQPDFDCTAVFAHNDLLAVGAIDALSQRGLQVPEQISVVGFNDNPLTGHLKPGLTTIKLQIDRMGREAAGAVVAIMSKSGNIAQAVSIRPELVVRESSAPHAGLAGRVEQDLSLDRAGGHRIENAANIPEWLH